jgi:hypothetical protein
VGNEGEISENMSSRLDGRAHGHAVPAFVFYMGSKDSHPDFAGIFNPGCPEAAES